MVSSDIGKLLDVQRPITCGRGNQEDDTLPERFFTDAVPLADKEVIPPRIEHTSTVWSAITMRNEVDRTTGAPSKKLAKLGIR